MLENMKKLMEIAEEDGIFILWHRAWSESRAEFEAFGNAQPEHIRKALWSYAEGGRLAWQRIATLACRDMAFRE